MKSRNSDIEKVRKNEIKLAEKDITMVNVPELLRKKNISLPSELSRFVRIHLYNSLSEIVNYVQK